MKRSVLFVLSLLLWMLLTWTLEPATVIAGVAAALLVALVMRDITTGHYGRWLDPRRYFWAVIYVFVFTYYVLKANFDVAYRVLHPAMPIEPGIVKVKTKLQSPEARTALANSITLTPGTLTVDMTDDGTIYVHWINVKSKAVSAASELIIGRFEWFLKRILD